MLIQRFGRKFKLSSTAAIKHQLLMLMLEDEIKAASPDESFTPDTSAALGKLRRLQQHATPASGQTWPASPMPSGRIPARRN